MSSALRTFSQVEPTVKFLRAFGTPVVATNAQMDTFLASPARVVESRNGINTIAYSDGEISRAGNATDGRLVRDLGRRVTIVSTAVGAAHRQIWLQVQTVAGSGSEGVPADAVAGTYWIRIYDAAGVATTGWARLG